LSELEKVWGPRSAHHKEDSIDEKQIIRLLSADFIAILKENVDRIFERNGLNETIIKYYQKYGEWDTIGDKVAEFFGCFLVCINYRF